MTTYIIGFYSESNDDNTRFFSGYYMEGKAQFYFGSEQESNAFEFDSIESAETAMKTTMQDTQDLQIFSKTKGEYMGFPETTIALVQK